MLDLSKLRDAVRHEGGVSRRLFLAYASALAALPLLAERSPAAAAAAPSAAGPSFPTNPFALGVASGDPDHAGVVLWTRLAPAPLDDGGGMKPEPVTVRWEVAEDDGMRRVVKGGTAAATPELNHAVHVEVDGLKPDRWYWYRFHAGDATSPVGRTRTLPEPSANPSELRFAFASCQHYEAGLWTAYEAMAKDELDLVFHLGDYIYEGAPSKDAKDRTRLHHSPAATTLATYRLRHAQYRADPLLQAVHHRCPWFVTWDDHEVANNYAGPYPSAPKADPVAFLQRRAAAYQAYYEAMPLRKRSLPRGPDMQLYRSASFGRLAEFQVLDTRQYRTNQPYGENRHEIGADAMDPNGTILGRGQQAWLERNLVKSPATWNVLAQQVMMGLVDRKPGPEHAYAMDQWPAYAYERLDFMKWVAGRKVANPVVLTGDIHSNWVNDLRVDDRKPETPVVATEFVGTSISSGGDGVDKPKDLETVMAENPCVKYHNAERGYVRCTVTPGQWRSDYVTVAQVSKPGGTVRTRASFVAEAGKPGAQKV